MTTVMHTIPKPRRERPKVQAILFTAGGRLFAVAADAVHEIRSADSLAGSAVEISQSPVQKVKHFVHRGARVYFVVNSCVHFGLRPTRPRLVLILRGCPAAVLVDKIERMENIPAPSPLPFAFRGLEREWYLGLAQIDDQLIPVVDPAGFLSNAELTELNATLRRAEAGANQELQGART